MQSKSKPRRLSSYSDRNTQLIIPKDKYLGIQSLQILRSAECGTFTIVREWCALALFTLKCASRHTFSTSQLPKMLRTPRVLTLFTFKRASRHNGVRFFDISTFKSAPSMCCFETFYFQICFAPQRGAIFHPSTAQVAPHPPL